MSRTLGALCVSLLVLGTVLGVFLASSLRSELRSSRERLDGLRSELRDIADLVNQALAARQGGGDSVPPPVAPPVPSDRTQVASAGASRAELGSIARAVEDLRQEVEALRRSLEGRVGPFVTGLDTSQPWVEPTGVLGGRSSGAGKGNNPDAPSWSALQMTGEPDTLEPGDSSTAWASLKQEEGEVSIEAEIERPIRASAVIIRETFNPGGVARVEVLSPGGEYVLVWQGDAPTDEPLRELEIGFQAVDAAGVRITVDTDRVQGWEEIDAIGLRAGSRIYWATAARASSSYGS